MSTLIAGSFRFLDFSGCETTHSPKVRTDDEVDAQQAQDGDSNARKGYAAVKLLNGTETWARRQDKPIFEAAEKILRDAQLQCRALVWKVSVPVGTGRAVRSARYTDFEAARTECQAIVQAANQSVEVQAANQVLSGTSKTMCIAYFPGLFPEMTLADPEDQVRAQRLQESCAESIALVLSAVRSQDRDQIRQALENVGALGDALTDSPLHGDVTKMLDLAQQTLSAITQRNRAAADANRARTAESGRRARERAQEAAQQLQHIQAQVEQTAESLSRFQVLDLRSDAEAEADKELTKEDLDAMQADFRRRMESERRFPQIEIGEVDVAAMSAEDRAAWAGAEQELLSRPEPARALEVE